MSMVECDTILSALLCIGTYDNMHSPIDVYYSFFLLVLVVGCLGSGGSAAVAFGGATAAPVAISVALVRLILLLYSLETICDN